MLKVFARAADRSDSFSYKGGNAPGRYNGLLVTLGRARGLPLNHCLDPKLDLLADAKPASYGALDC
jgi:hypothetical protein